MHNAAEARVDDKMCRAAHRQVEHVGQLRDAVEHERDEGKGDVGAKDAEGGDGGEVAEELLLLDGQARVEDDGRQQVPAPVSPIPFQGLVIINAKPSSARRELQTSSAAMAHATGSCTPSKCIG